MTNEISIQYRLPFDSTIRSVLIGEHTSMHNTWAALQLLVEATIVTVAIKAVYNNDELREMWQEAVALNDTDSSFIEWKNNYLKA